MASCPSCGHEASVESCRVSLDGGRTYLDRRYIRCKKFGEVLCPVAAETAGQPTQFIPRTQPRRPRRPGGPSE